MRSKPPGISLRLLLAMLCSWAGSAYAEWDLNMTRGVTSLSRDVYGLHMLLFWICVVIAVFVFGAMFVSIVLHRKSRGHEAQQFHHSTTAEVVWTVIPVLILIGTAVPATRVLIDMETTGDADLTVKVTGYQWRWQYEYIESGVKFFSSLEEKSNEARQLNSGIDPHTVENYLLEVDERMVVPVNKKVRILTTAADVIHAWWVPALGWKRDSIPGYINESWATVEEPGIYRGQCAELCGKDHGFMPIVLEAVDEATFNDWLSAKKAEMAAAAAASDQTYDKAALLANGEQVYAKTCIACHQANGGGIPGVFATLVNSAITVGSLDGHLDVVLNGRAGTAMAPFAQQLSDADIAAVITYERNSWGNADHIAEGTDVVQPADVKAARSVATAP